MSFRNDGLGDSDFGSTSASFYNKLGNLTLEPTSVTLSNDDEQVDAMVMVGGPYIMLTSGRDEGRMIYPERDALIDPRQAGPPSLAELAACCADRN